MNTDFLIHTVEGKLRELQLPLAVNFWHKVTVAGRTPAKATLELRAPHLLKLLAFPDIVRFAESYVNEEIDFQGSMRDLVGLIAPLTTGPRMGNWSVPFKWRLWRHGRTSDRRAIAFHYDVSNDFYALWLDQRRVYSCAYFKGPDDSLDMAQAQKLDHICRKLMLQPGERFLDIGCGWGALLLWAVEHYDVQAVGITLSQNQFDFVRQLVDQRGLKNKIDVRLLDYRDLDEAASFDKIASVGMFEHVGIRNLSKYFSKIQWLLRPGGLVLNHGVTATAFDQQRPIPGAREFIDKYVFPDGELVHVSSVIETMARTGLDVRDVESLRPHYARTLWHWVERLEAQHADAVALVGEKRYRIWRAYMAGFAMSFERNWNSIYQILAGRPDANGAISLPMTREYQYASSAQSQSVE